ncbi:hypothetical protein HDU88_008741 [Geranomyces variabilis]|nr:hypothetical protein HDU88_008741 [Geranomyces variabilis]
MRDRIRQNAEFRDRQQEILIRTREMERRLLRIQQSTASMRTENDELKARNASLECHFAAVSAAEYRDPFILSESAITMRFNMDFNRVEELEYGDENWVRFLFVTDVIALSKVLGDKSAPMRPEDPELHTAFLMESEALGSHEDDAEICREICRFERRHLNGDHHAWIKLFTEFGERDSRNNVTYSNGRPYYVDGELRVTIAF